MNEGNKMPVDKENIMLRRSVAGYKGQVKMLQKRIEALEANLSEVCGKNQELIVELEESNALCTTYKSEIELYKKTPWYKRLLDW